MEESGYKSHHFVPVTYQKRWTDKSEWDKKTQSIIIYHLPTSLQKSAITKDQAQKKNLYTKKVIIEGVDQKSLEKLMFPIFEKAYSDIMSKTLDNNEISFSSEQIKGLTNFAFIQSIRSEKEIRNTIERRNRMKETFKEYENMFNSFSDEQRPFVEDDRLMLEAAIIKELPSFLRRANLQILIAPKNHNFITSDNPSSIWYKDGLDFRLIGSSYPSLNDYDRYFLCPLSPKYCAFVRVSTLIDNKILSEDPERLKIEKIPYEFINLNVEDIKNINKMVIKSADKILFFSDEKDKQYL
ncbi:MAG: DUF4238 domain-containing protein [Pedobacter sp.]